MKRMIAVLMACLMLAGAAHAAEWAEGTSPERPYPGVPKVDLTTQIGYMLNYPKAGNAAECYCDTLYIYLPREDLVLGDGQLTVMTGEGEWTGVSFADAERVRLYPLDGQTLSDVRWGGGICVEVWLPVSLPLADGAWIEMEEACLVTESGASLEGLPKGDRAWRAAVGGEYGVGGLRFTHEGDDAPLAQPAAGDLVKFDLQLGGDAAMAAIESANGSVTCDAGEGFAQSCEVTLRLLDDDFQWTVYFLDDAGNAVDVLDFDTDMVRH